MLDYEAPWKPCGNLPFIMWTVGNHGMTWSKNGVVWPDRVYKSFSLLLGCTCLGPFTRNSRFSLELLGGREGEGSCLGPLVFPGLPASPVSSSPKYIKCKENPVNSLLCWTWVPEVPRLYVFFYLSESFYVCFMCNIQC